MIALLDPRNWWRAFLVWQRAQQDLVEMDRQRAERHARARARLLEQEGDEALEPGPIHDPRFTSRPWRP